MNWPDRLPSSWLQDVDHLERHDHLPAKSDLGNLISRRLRFETVSEYGFNSRIGRTLEKSGASVIRPDAQKLDQVVEQLTQMLPNEMEELRSAFTNRKRSGQIHGQTQGLPLRDQPDGGHVSPQNSEQDNLDKPQIPQNPRDTRIGRRGGPCVRPIQDTAAQTNIEHTLSSFLLGLIMQIKALGGIFDPDLENYIRNWGKEYLLSQRHIMWMPSFGPKTRTPGFVTTRPGRDRFPQLTRSGSRPSWFEWWAYRHFPDLALRQPTPVQRFYGLVFSCLQDQGLIRD
ncbi:MAG: hypothetical protein KGY41_09220, partial [Desulfovermiculus sp.]|nr:hypothetical protein [Desulfovermiculus sp.]